MCPPSLDELEGLIDAFFPQEACPNCKGRTATIEIKCPCKFELKSCAECLSNNREPIHEALKEHASRCDDGGSILSAMGY